MERLTSLQNPRVKRAVKLRQHRARERSERFLIEGYREILRAVETGFALEELFISPQHFLGHNEPALIERARRECGAEILEVAPHVFEKLAYRDRPEGLLAVAPCPRWNLDRLAPAGGAGPPLYVVATAIEKPGNLGTMLRCADAAGADGVIVCDQVTDVFNPNVVRASIGTLFTVPVAGAASAELLPWLCQHGIRIAATTPDGETCLWDADLTGPLALILGSEQLGLDRHWLEAADLRLTIPMAGHADSLNVAMATTVLLFEARRQRRREKG